MEAAGFPGLGEILVLGLIGLATVGSVAALALGVAWVLRPGRRRADEAQRHQIELLQAINDSVAQLDRRIQALEAHRPEAVDRKDVVK